MSRRKRITIPNLPHHVTQRGAHRQPVFFEEQDREIYLNLLTHYGEQYGVKVLSYCLMTNHVHHLMVPKEADSLRWTLQLTHKRYAEIVNAKHGWTGHLWQGRFYSSVVDENFLGIAIKYIERNPVEAGLTSRAEDYRWSSAAAHCGKRTGNILLKSFDHESVLGKGEDWSRWLGSEDDSLKVRELVRCTEQDLPCGSEQFISGIENEYGLKLRPASVGRPRKLGQS